MDKKLITTVHHFSDQEFFHKSHLKYLTLRDLQKF